MWPIENVEYGSFQWLQREIARAMGFNPASVLLDFNQESAVNSVIESGSHQFYFPPPQQMTIANPTESQKERLRRAPHAWSFLRDVTTIDLIIGNSSYVLPENFASFIDEPTMTGGNPLAIANEPHIRQLLSNVPEIGIPRYVAVRSKIPTDGSKPQHLMLVYPVPRSAYAIQIQHTLKPPKLSEDNPWPLSGVDHAETLLACCLSIVDERSGKDSGARTRMMERLTASVLMDQLSASPADVGVWPEGADDLPSATHGYLRKMVGVYFGYGPNKNIWTSQQSNQIKEAVRLGLSRFFNPEILPGERRAHRWSFLTPTITLATVAGQEFLSLPQSVVSVNEITHGSDQLYGRGPIPLVSESQVRQANSTFMLHGVPQAAAIRTSLYSSASSGLIDPSVFISTWRTDRVSAGSSDDRTISLPLDASGTYNFSVDWGDGTSDNVRSGSSSHRYGAPGTYVISITGTINGFQFNNAGDKLKLVSIDQAGSLGLIDGGKWFYGCSNLTSIAADLDTSGLTDLGLAWNNCSSLASMPFIDTSSVTNFFSAWFGCSSLTSFPLLDTSSGVVFTTTWYNCNSLLSFPQIEASSAASFYATWVSCVSLRQFPLLNFSNCTNFYGTWYGCAGLTSLAVGQGSAMGSMTTGDVMLVGCTFTTVDYSRLLQEISSVNANTGVLFGGGNSKYDAVGGVTSRNVLLAKSWTITDGGPA